MYDQGRTECRVERCYRLADRGEVLCWKHLADENAARRALAARQAAQAPPPPTLMDTLDPPALPAMPYSGTSGHAGTAASAQRATAADTDGSTAARQARVLDTAQQAGPDGITWRDVAAVTGWHHGTVSGALSVLSRQGYLVCLEVRRHGSHVYVLPHHQHGRPAATRRATAGTRAALEALDTVDRHLAAGDTAAARHAIQTARRTLAG